MREVIEETIRALQRKEPCVLATVVRTRGMTPQKAGARQLIRQDGTSVGTLGGGCVEGDIWYYAKEILRKNGGPEFRDYKLNEELAAQDGLVCGGTMYFFVEPFWQPEAFLSYAAEIKKAYSGGQPVALATVVSASSGEETPGTKLLIRQDGSVLGGFNNPKLQQKVIDVARRIAPFGKNEVVQEGGAEVYVEGFTTPPTLVLMGGGHVGKAVYQLAVMLGFRVFVVDDRKEFCNNERFPKAAQTVIADFDEALHQLPINFNTFILVATRGHRYDDAATRAAVSTPARYIGLLGSKRKNLLIFRELLDANVPLEHIKQIHAPVGLDIGALTPEELAVSIMGEIVMCLRGGEGGPLKMQSESLGEMIERV